VLRVTSKEGEIKVQDSGILKLSKDNKAILKEQLMKIAEEIKV
jgi:hypothetical protein